MPSKPAATERPATSAKAARAPAGVRQLYVAKCAGCHASDGSGHGTIGRSMNVPSFSSPQVQAQSDQQLAAVITSGRGKMPAYAKKLTTAQIKELAAYVRTLGTK